MVKGSDTEVAGATALAAPRSPGDAEARSAEPRPDEPAKAGCGRCGNQANGGCAAKNATPAVPSLLSTGDLARECETTVRTVRFYEEEGLIEPVARTDGGHRMFVREDLPKLQLIMDLREAGLSLQDIKRLFELKKASETAPEASRQMAEVLEAQIACMQRKIAVLRRLREELASMVAVIRECEGCPAPDFHEKCGDCDVMKRGDLPRAMKLLWSSRG